MIEMKWLTTSYIRRHDFSLRRMRRAVPLRHTTQQVTGYKAQKAEGTTCRHHSLQGCQQATRPFPPTGNEEGRSYRGLALGCLWLVHASKPQGWRW